MDDYLELLNTIFSIKFKTNDFRALLTQLSQKDLKASYAILTGNYPKLTKKDLIEYFLQNYQSLLKGFLSVIHTEILDLIFDIVDNNGEFSFEHLNPSETIYLKSVLIAFPVVRNSDYLIIIPQSTLDLLKSLDREALYKNVEINNTIIRYSRKLVDTFGRVPFSMLEEYLKEYESLEINSHEYLFLLNSDSLYTGNYDIEDDIIYHVDFSQEIEEAIDNDLDFYHLSKTEIDEEHLDEERDLLSYLLIELDMDDDFSADFVGLILRLIKQEAPLDEIYASISPLKISKGEHALLKKKIKYLYENTPLFSLKGHTLKNKDDGAKLIAFKKTN